MEIFLAILQDAFFAAVAAIGFASISNPLIIEYDRICPIADYFPLRSTS